MSQGLQANPGHNQVTSSSGSYWRKILDLGQHLLGLTPNNPPIQAERPEYSKFPDGGVIPAQQKLILTAVNELMPGQASLWLTRRLGIETGYFRHKHALPAPLISHLESVFVDEPGVDLAAQAWQPPFEPAQALDGLAVPLLNPAHSGSDDPLLGVLLIQRSEGTGFSPVEVELFAGISLQASIAIQARRQMAVDRIRTEQLELISRVGKAITSILDQAELLERVVLLIHDLFDYPLVHIYSVHHGRRKIFLEAGNSSASQELIKKRFSYDLDDPHGILPWVARGGETAQVNDISLDFRFRPSAVAPELTRAELAVPLEFAGEVLGILDIHSEYPDAFGAGELLIFEALADDIAIALRNATLYRSERWRRQVGDSLREIAGMLSAQTDLDRVLGAILEELERSLPCDLAAVWFIDEDQPDHVEAESFGAGLPALRLVAVRGKEADWLHPQLGLGLEEILDVNGLDGAPDSPAPAWLELAARADGPIIRTAGSQQDLFGLALEFPPDYSAIAAPLWAGEHRLGILTLAHSTSGRYGGEASAMAAAFASYAAVAIQNTRLYASAHDQVWVSSVLLQVAETTQSLADLNELLTTVAHIIPTLVGVKACAIYLLDDTDNFIPAAEAGLSRKTRAEFASRFFLPGEIPSLDHLRTEKRPTIVPARGADLQLASLIMAEPETKPSIQFLIAVPLLAHGVVLGALLAQYASDLIRTNLRTLEDYFDERMSILQGIAHQTATAVENIRLARGQKEEAYITVAFLQVAQAIVNAGNLKETLGSIARITPILTGVKRVGFYLLDADCQCFRLAESYGMPYNADLYVYAPEEFPLLEAAWERNSMVAHPLDIKAPGADLDWDDIPDVWSLLPAPDPEDLDTWLEAAARLLLVLPLSIKGKVIGLLLVEEPGDAPRGNKERLETNSRLRMKRLEIITGISQQAALAIQSDQLQHEMVDRERLEREMQLAREIQQAFLPSQFPKIPDWQINVWWRTAREMGGDFYDLIDLPSGQLGIVIADVADKGLPAALFMTLIRALLRATVSEERSPSQVLETVNHLLIPDARQGTFVTIFYAVLDASTGQFTYANAGHNPPLWVRTNQGRIELLTRGGMALGVLDDSTVEQRTITLERGDYLIMYTDGVTDGLSPQGVIYDFERLYQVVWDTAFESPVKDPSAAEMLAGIDQSIQDFVGDTPAVDDSTALVFHFSP